MDLWIIATLLAASFQTLRFMLQKQLAGAGLSATGATFARFAYSAPLAVGALATYLFVIGQGLPQVPASFWFWAALAGMGQILATVLVVLTFSMRNFAVGITLKKTEVIQTAMLGAVVLGEAVSVMGWLGIGIGLVGVLLLSKTPNMAGGMMRQLRSPAVILGLGAGFFFAFAGVGVRAATLAVESDDPLMRAAFALVIVTTGQALGMALWLGLRDRAEIAKVWAARRKAVWMGAASVAGSLGWFTAFTLQTAAYVYALGQVELILSLAASVFFFKERVTGREVLGIAVLTISILVLILAA